MSIEGLKEILSNRVDGNKIFDVKVTSLVGPGENYGGELLKLEIETEDEKTKQKKVVHAVAKKIPPNEAFQQVFNIQKTFKAEINFYEKIVPILQGFQREQGLQDVIDCFAKFYGSRLNLNGTNTVDKDAVMIMENLIVSGYRNLNRHIGYNLEETELLLKNIANLHATFLAIKLKKRDIFEKKLRPLCDNVLTPAKDDPFNKFILVLAEIFLEEPKTVPWVSQIKEVWDKYSAEVKYEVREPFATFAHCDLWVNNVMMKHNEGKPSKIKFVDFQIYNYKSPALDVLNFLTTSVQTNIARAHFDNLLKFYHSKLILKLRQLGVDSEPFSYKKFEKELEIEAPRACTWSMMFIPSVVFGLDHSLIENLDFSSQEERTKLKQAIAQGAKEKLYFIVDTFAEKGWLNSN